MSDKKRTLVSCAMLEDEVTHIIKETESAPDLIWVERGLHNTPQKLHEILQLYINQLQDQDEILLTYSLCGTGTAGLCSKHTILRLPRFDDCINLLLCQNPRTARRQTEKDTLYLTRGWTRSAQSLLQQYNQIADQYDAAMRDTILQKMYDGYKKICVIDTGCYDTAPVTDYAGRAASLLSMENRIVPGSIQTLRHLIDGTPDDNIITLSPGEILTAAHFDF